MGIIFIALPLLVLLHEALRIDRFEPELTQIALLQLLPLSFKLNYIVF